MARSLKIILPVIVVAVVLFLIFRSTGDTANPASQRKTAPLVKLASPARETVLYTRQFNGDVLPVQQASVYSKVTGNLERVYVDIGTPVRQGQLLALVDTTELSQQYQQAAASYQNASSGYERTKGLFEKSLASKQDMDNSEAAMIVAKSLYDGAATRLSYAQITAPFSGLITKRFLDPGAVLTSTNSTLFTLMDLDRMKVTGSVLEKDVPLVSIGTTAIVEVDAYPDRKFEGAVSRTGESLDPATRTMAVQIDIPNPRHELKPGMFASVTLIVDQHANAVTVPTEALVKDDKGFTVYTAVGDTARRIRVSTGVEQNNRIEVLSGLDGSERLIVAGQQFCKDGGAVTIQK